MGESAHEGARTPDDALFAMLGIEDGDLMGDKYRILGRIGRGGMGAVFRARNEAIGRLVAIKVMRPDADVARFEREARAATHVRHPHIVDVFDLGVHEGRPYIVMELLEGETLGALMKRDGPLPVSRAVALVAPILRALDAAHQRGIVHRDIKPDNVFLARPVHGDREPVVKLLDFGVAKWEAPDVDPLTSGPQALGTVAYMAPEQIMGSADAGPAMDQYAVGVLLFEMLTGRLPHDGKSQNEMLVRKVAESPKNLAQLRPDLTEALVACVMKAIAARPTDRHASVDALRVGLEALHATEAPGDAVRAIVADADRPSKLGIAETARANTPMVAARPSTDGASRTRPRWRIAAVAVAVAAAVAALAAASSSLWETDRPSPPGLSEHAAPPPSDRPLPPVLRDGEDAVMRLTTNPAALSIRSGTLSGDGRLAAYVDANGVHVRVLATGETRDYALPEGVGGSTVSFQPDGSRVVLSAYRGEDDADLLSISLLTGEQRIIRRDAWSPTFSPDGAHIAFIERDGLMQMNADATDARPVYRRGADEGLSDVAWSPDSRWIVWGRGGGVPTELMIARADGGEPRSLARIPQLIVEQARPVWLAGDYVVYAVASSEPGLARIQVFARAIDPDAAALLGEPVRMPGCRFEACYLLGASADARRLVFERWSQQTDVVTARFERGGQRLGALEPIQDSDADEHASGWTRDGEVLSSGTEGGSFDIFATRPGAERPRAVVRSPDMDLFPAAADDGSVLFFRVRSDADSGEVDFRLMRVNADGSLERELVHATEPTLDELYATEIPHLPPFSQRVGCWPGAGCVTSRADGDTLTFYRLDPSDGTVQPLRSILLDWTRVSYSWTLGPGAWVTLVTHKTRARPELTLLSLTDERSERIDLPSSCEPHSAGWAPGQNVLVVCSPTPQDRRYVLLRVDRRTGTTTELWSDLTGLYQPELSPDEQQVAFTRLTGNGDLFMLEARH